MFLLVKAYLRKKLITKGLRDKLMIEIKRWEVKI